MNFSLPIHVCHILDPCSHVTCPEGTLCKLNERREPTCRCSEQCQLDYKPVCASDGHTYSNPCVMNVQACKQRTQLRIYANGLCEHGMRRSFSIDLKHDYCLLKNLQQTIHAST